MGVTDFPADDIQLSNFLSGDHFSQLAIPAYQRGYSWTQDQLDDFWSDLKDVKDDPDDEQYFFGTLVCINNGSSSGLHKYQLVDGQQRMATCLIFLSVIRDIFLKLKSTHADTVQKEITNWKLKQSDPLFYKIKLDDDDDYFIKDTIFQKILPPNDKFDFVKSSTTKYQTHKNIKNAYLFFYETLWNYLDTFTDLSSKENELNDFDSRLRLNFVITLQEVNKESRAYVIFDRVNNRGLDLATSDLVKDFILSLVNDDVTSGKSSISLDDAVKLWREISNSYGKEIGKLNDFFHHFLNAYYSIDSSTNFRFIGKGKTYDEIVSITKIQPAGDFLKELCEKNRNYRLLRYDIKISPQISKKCFTYLKWLKKLNVKIVYPLLMVAIEKYNKNDFEKLCLLCLKYMFRAKTVANVNASQLENELAEIAFEVKNNGSTYQDVHKKLSNSQNNPSDESFKSRIKDMEFSQSSHASYALSQIIESQQPAEYTDIQPQKSVEHIMPKTIDDDWSNYIISQNTDVKSKSDAEAFKERYKNYLGNLTIISLPKNISLKNRPFYEKSKKYKTSSIKITKEISKYSDWNAKSIQKRTNSLADLAVSIWQL